MIAFEIASDIGIPRATKNPRGVSSSTPASNKFDDKIEGVKIRQKN